MYVSGVVAIFNRFYLTVGDILQQNVKTGEVYVLEEIYSSGAFFKATF